MTDLSRLRALLEAKRVPCSQDPESCMGRMHEDGSHRDPRAAKALEILEEVEDSSRWSYYNHATIRPAPDDDWLLVGALLAVARELWPMCCIQCTQDESHHDVLLLDTKMVRLGEGLGHTLTQALLAALEKALEAGR